MTSRVLIVVTHLLGAGHLTRAASLARAFAARGHRPTLVSGGMPAAMVRLDGVDLVQLPPVRTVGTDFRTLLDEAGDPVGEERLRARIDLLLATLTETRPAVVITELFPFGRRVLAGEFTALLEAAHGRKPRPLVLCSIRDILAAPKPERVQEAHDRIARFYDGILVHGDPALVPLEASWPVNDAIRPLLAYTGYVDEGSREDAPSDAPAVRGGILVSGGSSAASLPLYRAAARAAAQSPGRSWRLLVGNGVPGADFRDIQAAAPPSAMVERARRDFRALLRGAAVSVSQAGYNTVVDLLRAGPSPVLVPFEAGQETEQRLRAEELQARGLATLLSEAELTASSLAAAVDAALKRGAPAHSIALDGAARSVERVEEWLAGAPAPVRRIDWSALADAIGQARDSGREPLFWWRDDDAVAETPALNRLFSLAERYRSPVALAVIAEPTEASLRPAIEAFPLATALVHGWAHRNHAGPGGKKAEFGADRPVEVLEDEAGRALGRLRETLDARLLPVFVPPWNRIDPKLVPRLSGLGFTGLSTFRDRETDAPAPGLLQVNCHVDPIDWHGTRSLYEPEHLVRLLGEAIRRRLAGEAEGSEPIGFLTHHLVHDEAVWTFCEALLERIAAEGLRFRAADEIFSGRSSIVVQM